MVWLYTQVNNYTAWEAAKLQQYKAGGDCLQVNLDDTQPIFQQIARILMDEIVEGRLQEEERVPSENELSRFYSVNRATVRNGLQSLLDAGLIYKQRGIGMFVKEGARKKLLAERRNKFEQDYLQPLLEEAKKIGINPEGLIEMIKRGEL